MPRRRLPRPADVRPATEDVVVGLDDWGVPVDDPEEDPPEDDELGAPPALPVAEPATPPSQALAALGPPPEDTLAAEKWAHSVLMQQAYETMMSELPETTRRKEVRTILRDARGHVTDAARYDYMKLVERDRRELENQRRGRAAATPVKRGAPPAAAKLVPVIPPDE